MALSFVCVLTRSLLSTFFTVNLTQGEPQGQRGGPNLPLPRLRQVLGRGKSPRPRAPRRSRRVTLEFGLNSSTLKVGVGVACVMLNIQAAPYCLRACVLPSCLPWSPCFLSPVRAFYWPLLAPSMAWCTSAGTCFKNQAAISAGWIRLRCGL